MSEPSRRFYGAPLYRVLTRPKTLMGVDRSVAGIIWALTAWMVLVFNNPWQLALLWLGIGYAIHVLARAFFKREPLMFRIYKRYMRQSDRYEPWPYYAPKRGLRPHGFGRVGWKA